MNRWHLAILRAFAETRDGASLQDVYRRLPSLIELTRDHLRPTKHGGRPAFQHQVRSHVTDLRQAAQLRQLARGRYAITALGRARLARRD